MNKLKINIIYGDESINEIIIKSLINDIKNNLKSICNQHKYEIPSSCTYLNQDKVS
ncbi:MAG: hypothetical protein Q4G04_02460 [bacterium]|nr:hypothetical protein [bacterium]